MVRLEIIIREGNQSALAELLAKDKLIASSILNNGLSILQYAAYCKNPEAVDLIRKKLDKITPFEAATIGEKETLIQLVSESPQLLAEFSSDGFTLLGLASFFGHLSIVRFLLSIGANPNIPSQNDFRVTPLHSACAISNIEISKLLIKYGASVNASQRNGVTPLHSAAHSGNLDLVRLLLENGSVVDSKMEGEKTPIDLALEGGHHNVVKLLKEKSQWNF